MMLPLQPQVNSEQQTKEQLCMSGFVSLFLVFLVARLVFDVSVPLGCFCASLRQVKLVVVQFCSRLVTGPPANEEKMQRQ